MIIEIGGGPFQVPQESFAVGALLQCMRSVTISLPCLESTVRGAVLGQGGTRSAPWPLDLYGETIVLGWRRVDLSTQGNHTCKRKLKVVQCMCGVYAVLPQF